MTRQNWKIAYLTHNCARFVVCVLCCAFPSFNWHYYFPFAVLVSWANITQEVSVKTHTRTWDRWSASFRCLLTCWLVKFFFFFCSCYSQHFIIAIITFSIVYDHNRNCAKSYDRIIDLCDPFILIWVDFQICLSHRICKLSSYCELIIDRKIIRLKITQNQRNTTTTTH